MKTLYPISIRRYPAKKINLLTLFALLFSLISPAQDISFTNYKLVGGAAGQKGATYHFSSVTADATGKPTADCIVKIESITPGVKLKQLNQNNNGNTASFQPELEYQNMTGPSWIEFSFTFVGHAAATQYNNLHNIPVITTSVSGLNNYGTAQEFAECNLGSESKIVYNAEITQLMISATGMGYRAENKWGSRNASNNTASSEKLSVIHKNVTEIRIKIGVNRNNNVWSGTSTYNIELKDAGPDMTQSYMPEIVGFQARVQENQVELAWSSPNQDNLQDISVEKSLDGEIFREVGRFRKTDMEKDGLYRFTDPASASTTMGAAFYRLRTRDMEGNFQYSSVKMVSMKKKDDYIKTDISIDPENGQSVLLTPLGWQQKDIFVEIYNNDGALLKKIEEKKAGAQVIIDMKNIAGGAYVVRLTCGKQYSTQYLIHSENL